MDTEVIRAELEKLVAVIGDLIENLVQDKLGPKDLKIFLDLTRFNVKVIQCNIKDQLGLIPEPQPEEEPSQSSNIKRIFFGDIREVTGRRLYAKDNHENEDENQSKSDESGFEEVPREENNFNTPEVVDITDEEPPKVNSQNVIKIFFGDINEVTQNRRSESM